MMNRYLVLTLVVLSLATCGGEPTPTPDLVATQIAVELAAHATMTAGAPPATNSVPTELPQATATGTPQPADTPEPEAGDVRLRDRDGMEMVYVPAGEFLMGSTDADGGAEEDEKPQHRVYLDAFWIDRTEVSNAQYHRCAQAGSCGGPRTCDYADPTYDDDSKSNHPVVCVRPADAEAYCQWAGARLPTEAEWEKAARGTDGRTYPWGDDFDGSRLNYCDRNCEEDWKDTGADDGYAGTAPVGSYEAGASPYGVLDMAGNVREWVADWYDGYYYERSPVRNPQGPAAGQYPALRGGAWNNQATSVRSAYRINNNPDIRLNYNGFRCGLAATQIAVELAAHATTTAGAPPATTSVPTPETGDVRVRERDGMEMAYVPAGEFLMGSTDADGDADYDEKPQHRVYLDAFWIDRTQVSNAQYRRCAQAGACTEPLCWDRSEFSAPDQPVVCVSWFDAEAYCLWAGAMLPPEAEWEKAARGSDGRIYPWGNDFDCSKGNFDDETQDDDYVVPGGEGCDGYVKTAPAGSFPAGSSPYGVLDMAGNVWEWVADWYDADYYEASQARNPPGPDAGVDRVRRGGAWDEQPRYGRSAGRDWGIPDYGHYYLGFRCGMSPTSSP